MQDIEVQGIPADPAEKPQEEEIRVYPWQQALSAAVDAFAEGSAHQEPAKAREDGEIVTADKNALCPQADGKEVRHFHRQGLQPEAQSNKSRANYRQGPEGQLAEQGIEDHAQAQHMKDAEPDADAGDPDDLVHIEGHIADEQSCAEHRYAPLKGRGGEGCADAGDQHEENVAVLPDKNEPLRQGKAHAAETGQVKDQMHADHSQDADAPQGVQFPNTRLLRRHCFASSSSSSTR